MRGHLVLTVYLPYVFVMHMFSDPQMFFSPFFLSSFPLAKKEGKVDIGQLCMSLEGWHDDCFEIG